jgi:hypothetical protein
MTARNGSAEWHGDVQSGSGTITVGEHVFEGPFSYESRFAEGEGTNPEQRSPFSSRTPSESEGSNPTQLSRMSTGTRSIHRQCKRMT